MGAAPIHWRPVPLVCIRHGETDWSRARRHTGRTDLPLTPRGESQARAMGRRLAGITFAAVWISPAQRVSRTAELAGLAPAPRVLAELAEFDYGRFEGLTTADIRLRRPGWEIWRDGAEGGETPAAVLERACRALTAIQDETPPGMVAVVSHGHLLRALTMAYLDLPVAGARNLMLDVASISILDEEHGHPAVRLWNLAAATDPGRSAAGRHGRADPPLPRPSRGG